MKSLVVYHSQFGNTRTLAEIVHAELQAFGPAELTTVDAVTDDNLKSLDLLVVGGPTQAHGTSPAVKPFLSILASKDLSGTVGATFDTRLKGPAFLWGSAAKPAAHRLEQAGLKLVVPPESFLVQGMKEPHLEEGELERARAWGKQLGELVTRQQPVAQPL
jgi:flavodoxin